jgi:hypothetical protein
MTSDVGSVLRSDCTTTLVGDMENATFTATLLMSNAEFNEGTRIAYLSGVVNALNIKASAVQITSVSEQQSTRRLLSSTTLVETKVTVAPEEMASVVSAITFENLNSFMVNANIPLGDISAVTTGTTPQTTSPTPTPDSFIIPLWLIIAAAGGLLIVLIMVFRYTRSRPHSERESSYHKVHKHDHGHRKHHVSQNVQLDILGFMQQLNNQQTLLDAI